MRCAGRSSGPRTRRTRWPRGGGARRARGSRRAAPPTGRPLRRRSHGSCSGRYRQLPHPFESEANRLTPRPPCGRMRRMPRSYKICSPFVPGVGSHDTVADAVSDQLAANERVDNTRVVPVRRGADMRLRAAVEKFKLWDNGRRLRVKFIDGVPEVQDKVAKIAKEWETVANLRLDFVTGATSELRVSFAEKGFSWSTVGTDALTVGRTKATVNLGWLDPSTALREYQRVVRHEFGHALGMIHEHQNPAAQGVIPWDKPKVYAYYALQGWSKDDVDSNIFEVYSDDSTNHTEFDPTSIM